MNRNYECANYGWDCQDSSCTHNCNGTCTCCPTKETLKRKVRLFNIMHGFDFTTEAVCDVILGLEDVTSLNKEELNLYNSVKGVFTSNYSLLDIYNRFKTKITKENGELIEIEFPELFK